MKDRKLLGDLGEELAAGILYAEGFDILERKFRCRFGELDLILRKNGVICFCEVKTRMDGEGGEPEEAVDGRKRRRMRGAAAYYLKEQHLEHAAVTFLVMGIRVTETMDPFLE